MSNSHINHMQINIKLLAEGPVCYMYSIVECAVPVVMRLVVWCMVYVCVCRWFVRYMSVCVRVRSSCVVCQCVSVYNSRHIRPSYESFVPDDSRAVRYRSV